jgi:plastocyanin
VACASCSRSGAPQANPPAAEPAAAASGVISGGHRVSGTVPPSIDGAASIVILEPTPERELPLSEPAALDQVQKMFTPDVLFVRTGQPVEFRNSDDTLHNVNVSDETTKAQLFNVAIVPETVFRYTFAAPGLYDAHCDIHQTMTALIVASRSPYAKVADPDGAFEFDDVQAGAYTATVYSGVHKLEQPIEVSGPATTIALKD